MVSARACTHTAHDNRFSVIFSRKWHPILYNFGLSPDVCVQYGANILLFQEKTAAGHWPAKDDRKGRTFIFANPSRTLLLENIFRNFLEQNLSTTFSTERKYCCVCVLSFQMLREGDCYTNVQARTCAYSLYRFRIQKENYYNEDAFRITAKCYPNMGNFCYRASFQKKRKILRKRFTFKLSQFTVSQDYAGQI